MGPRSFNRGNPWSGRSRPTAASSFNGAAVFQPRKCAGGEAVNADTRWLQWGRGLSTAEIGICWGAVRRAGGCFNGAAVFQPRK